MSKGLLRPSRRAFLRNAGSGMLAMGGLPGRRAWGKPVADAAWTPLGTLGAAKDIAFGFALNARMLVADATYEAVVARECTIVTPENAMKWEGVHPGADVYTFAQADAIVDFAGKHSMKVRGHAFCWHRALPPWVTRDATTKETAERILRAHIATVAGRYKGKLYSWDVVNEAIQLRDGLADGWRNSFWYQVLGPSYVDIAFEAAREADPSAILCYNDFGLEYANAGTEAKRTAVLAMLRNLRKRGVPVQGLGLQSHLRAGTGEKFNNDLPRFIREVHDLGVKVFLTELDVDDQHLTVEGVARDQAIADVYAQYLDLVLGTGVVPVVVTWGVWDIPHVTGAEAALGPKAERPLLFSPGGEPKLDAMAVAQAFRAAKTQQ
jgi:endo-1,4-beta-xylanase